MIAKETITSCWKEGTNERTVHTGKVEFGLEIQSPNVHRALPVSKLVVQEPTIIL